MDGPRKAGVEDWAGGAAPQCSCLTGSRRRGGHRTRASLRVSSREESLRCPRFAIRVGVGPNSASGEARAWLLERSDPTFRGARVAPRLDFAGAPDARVPSVAARTRAR